jgi:hypothetical protein
MVYLAGILSKFSNEVRAATTVSVYLLVYEIIMLGGYLYTMTALASNLPSCFFYKIYPYMAFLLRHAISSFLLITQHEQELPSHTDHLPRTWQHHFPTATHHQRPTACPHTVVIIIITIPVAKPLDFCQVFLPSPLSHNP